MAKHRYTINELLKEDHKEYLSDNKMIRAVISDRMGDCTNPNAPLYQRLKRLYNKIDKLVQEEAAKK